MSEEEPTMAIQQQAQRLISGDELYAMGDIGPCELVEGVIVPMSPTSDEHGAYELNVALELRLFADRHGLGKVRTGEVGVFTRRNPDTVRGADVVFISHERYAQKTGKGFLKFAPDLIVEVRSPTNTKAEIERKLAEYFAIDVRLVWVLDPELRTIFAYSAPNVVQTFGPADELTGEPVLPGFRVSVARLFEL
jgi:Uma2 family endonuclease